MQQHNTVGAYFFVFYEVPPGVDQVIWNSKTGGPKPGPMGNSPKGMEQSTQSLTLMRNRITNQTLPTVNTDKIMERTTHTVVTTTAIAIITTTTTAIVIIATITATTGRVVATTAVITASAVIRTQTVVTTTTTSRDNSVGRNNNNNNNSNSDNNTRSQTHFDNVNKRNRSKFDIDSDTICSAVIISICSAVII
jgi:hypothetical protein